MKNYLCAIYDIQVNIPELYSKEKRFIEPIGVLLNTIKTQSSIISRQLSQYFSSLEKTPYLTHPIADINNHNMDSYFFIPTILSRPLTKESDTYILTFKSETEYFVESILLGRVGEGSKNSDFTSSEGVFKIDSTSWVGEFLGGDKFFFAYEVCEDVLRLLTSYSVACSLLRGRYAQESINAMTGMQMDYCTIAKQILKNIIDGEIVLECQGNTEGQPPNSNEYWLGYDIDEKGLNLSINE